MYYLLFLLFVTCALMYSEKPSKTVLWSLIVFFILFIGLRGTDVDLDYHNYLAASKKGWGVAEISYFLISDLSFALTDDSVLIFVIYAAVGAITQFTAMYRYSGSFWLSVAFWFCTYFILLDMNAIRAGAAIGFAMLSWEPWSKGKHWQAIGFILLACFFHYSFFVLLAAYPFIRNNKKYLYLFLGLVPFAYVLHFGLKAFSILDVLNLSIVAIKSDAYNKTDTGQLPVFSTVLLFRMAVIALLFYYRETFEKDCDKFYLLLKLYCAGFFISVSLADAPVIAMRLLDIFACSELILLPLLYDVVKPKWAGIASVGVYAAFYFYIYFLQNEYLKPYEMII